MNRRAVLSASTAFIGLTMVRFYRARCAGAALPSASAVRYRIVHSDAEWCKILSPAADRVLRQGGTEPFSGAILTAQDDSFCAVPKCIAANVAVISARYSTMAPSQPDFAPA